MQTSNQNSLQTIQRLFTFYAPHMHLMNARSSCETGTADNCLEFYMSIMRLLRCKGLNSNLNWLNMGFMTFHKVSTGHHNPSGTTILCLDFSHMWQWSMVWMWLCWSGEITVQRTLPGQVYEQETSWHIGRIMVEMQIVTMDTGALCHCVILCIRYVGSELLKNFLSMWYRYSCKNIIISQLQCDRSHI